MARKADELRRYTINEREVGPWVFWPVAVLSMAGFAIVLSPIMLGLMIVLAFVALITLLALSLGLVVFMAARLYRRITGRWPSWVEVE